MSVWARMGAHSGGEDLTQWQNPFQKLGAEVFEPAHIDDIADDAHRVDVVCSDSEGEVDLQGAGGVV